MSLRAATRSQRVPPRSGRLCVCRPPLIEEGRGLSPMSGIVAGTAYRPLPAGRPRLTSQVPTEEPVPVLHLEPRGAEVPAQVGVQRLWVFVEARVLRSPREAWAAARRY
ncbi:hypothetical protein CFP59_04348 [Streptomyces malaysiensis subsp. malaysiensis]|nr:hypothetical protein CFP59_04348 [Streptomyces sp. M56]